jgi:hypothetical protein
VSLERLLKLDAVIVRRSQTGTLDEYGTPTWEQSETPVRCQVLPRSGEEIEDRPAGKVTHRGFLPGDVTVGHQDRLVLSTGQGWEIDGPPLRWSNPRTGKVSHIEVDLVEVS